MFLVFVLLFVSLPYSQDVSDTTHQDLNLGDILNLTLKTGSFLEINLKESPLSLTLIDAEKINNANTKSLGELLEIYVPGFQVMENKWVGEIWGMRGVASDINNKFILMINGNKTNSQARDGTIAEMYSYLGADVQRVEMLRGPAGLVYGSGAIAGIVNIVTKKPLDSDYFDTRIVAKVSDGQYNEKNGYRTVSAYGHVDLSSGVKLGLSGYFQQSDGVPMHKSKLAGLPSWNFPQWVSPDYDYNAWSQGMYNTVTNNGKSPAKFMLSTDLSFKDFNLYIRHSYNQRYGGGFFFDEKEEYQGISSDDQTEIEQYLIDNGHGDLIDHPDHLFWAAGEAWGENRRIYGTNYTLAVLSYLHEMESKNKLSLKVSHDILSEYIKYDKVKGYDFSEGDVEYMEQFGEQKTTVEAIFLLNAIERLKFAVGGQYRLDNIGNCIKGLNELNEDKTKTVVEDINYHNIALFTEANYDIIPRLSIHGGLRIDKHTRTRFVPSPKISLICKPLGEDKHHFFKLFYQTSSNNGAADSYEPNRYVPRDDEGNIIEGDYFEDPTKLPQLQDDIIRSITLEDLHALKPERTRSLEFASYSGFLDDKIQLETSVSFNSVENLFMWNQDYYHIFNTTDYQFGVAEGELRFQNKKVNFGINHSYTRLYKMRYEDHYTVIERNLYDRDTVINVNGSDTVVSNENWYTNIGTDEDPYYKPVPTGTEPDSMNAIYNMVSVDNKNFLNLSPNLTKVFLDIKPIANLTFHMDTRIFWSPLKGREIIHDNEAEHNDALWWMDRADWMNDEIWANYLDWYNKYGRPETYGIDNKPVLKTHISASYKIKDRVTVTLGVKDLFSDPTSDNEFIQRNSFRWQVMVSHGDQDLFTSDVRSVYGSILCEF